MVYHPLIKEAELGPSLEGAPPGKRTTLLNYSSSRKSNCSIFTINSKENEKVNIRDIWSHWLNKHSWNWFVSNTFRFTPTRKTADHKWYQWLKLIEQELDHTPGYFRVTEFQKRGTIHFHSLMLGVETLTRYTPEAMEKVHKDFTKKGINPLSLSMSKLIEAAIRTSWENIWNDISGYSRILKYDAKRGASGYVSKYVLKANGDYKLGGSILRT